MSAPTRSSVEVAIRVRPLRSEIHETKCAWEFSSSTAREVASPDTRFTFDHIYDVGSSTQEMYERSVQHSIVSRVAQGFNGTVFAYGQTGSGKTFTMFGDGFAGQQSPRARGSASLPTADGERHQGLIALAVRDLFQALETESRRGFGASSSTAGTRGRDSSSSPLSRPPAGTLPNSTKAATPLSGTPSAFEVYVSALEIYNEQLRDLLLQQQPSGQPALPLSIREGEHGVYVHNAVRHKVRSADECMRVIYQSAEGRVSASTAMNEYSSRSHCIIQLHVEKTVHANDSDDEDEDEDADDAASVSSHVTSASASSAASRRHGNGRDLHEKKLVSLLNLVDLAGSERVAKTGAVGQRMVEGGHINKSLTALTTVINRLSEVSSGSAAGAAQAFIPYRDSRLTHLLKTSLGGNSFTCIFCCVTPAVENVDESRSTLQFASRAKRIKNRVSVNEVMNPRTRVRELEVELRRVKRQLVAQTIYLWSKQVTIARMRERMDALLGDDATQGPADLTASPSSSHSRRRVGPAAQRQLIVEQLQAQNEALEQEVQRLKVNAAASPAAAARSGKDSVGEDVQQLRADVADLESMLTEMEKDKVSVERQLSEVNVLCRGLEARNEGLSERVKELESHNKEVEGLLEDLSDEREAAVAEAELARTQLQKTQSRLLEKNRGDAYLEELTQLHIEHQELQFNYSQLKESSQKQAKDLQSQLADAQQTQDDLEDEREEAKDQGKQLNAYLWRFLAVASLARSGRVEADAASPLAHADRPVPEHLIAAAIESLTKAVSSARTAGTLTDGTSSSSSNNNRGGGSRAESAALKEQIRSLETQLVNKDAQRDVLVDTKLKRMQDLVLRLHAMNNAMINEMRECFADNDELFRLAGKHPKLSGKLSKAGLFPRSLQSALEQARLAEPVDKPFGHN